MRILILIFILQINKIFQKKIRFFIDMSILNTMKDEKFFIAESLLSGTEISIIDAARLIRNILDAYKANSKQTAIEFCHKVINTGKRNLRTKEMNFANGLEIYIKSKTHLRIDSLRDIKYLSTRLLKAIPIFAKRNFSEFTTNDCEMWLNKTFSSRNQFNKARTMLHALFEFALRREWCDKNPIKFIERKKIIEKEIKPLTLVQTKHLLKTSQSKQLKKCIAGVAILTLAGIRPKEVRRLKWSDIDLNENSITIRSQCSKTGGVRQVEICTSLKKLLKRINISDTNSFICPRNWPQLWKNLRDVSGFKGIWQQDVLRHTYASFFAKHFQDMPRLQLNMGHHNQSLLRSRYVNMNGISKADAKAFFIA